MNKKVCSLLGFAAKAGRLSYGMAAAMESLKTGKSQLIVIASDISAKSKKETAFFAQKVGVTYKVLEDFDIETVSDAVGRQCGILSVNDSGFADAILNEYIEGGNANDQ